MLTQRTFALVLSMALHGALALFLALRVWNSVSLEDYPGEPDLTLVSFSVSPEEGEETQAQTKHDEPSSAPRSKSQPRKAAASVTQPALKEVILVDVSTDAFPSSPPPIERTSAEIAGVITMTNGKSGERAVRAVAPPSNTSKAVNAQEAYGAEVHRWIERRKFYPANLAARGLEGTVRVAFDIDLRGRLSGPVRIVDSSGEPVLDRLAQHQIQAASPFPRPPANSVWKRRSFTMPMTYRSGDG